MENILDSSGGWAAIADPIPLQPPLDILMFLNLVGTPLDHNVSTFGRTRTNMTKIRAEMDLLKPLPWYLRTGQKHNDSPLTKFKKIYLIWHIEPAFHIFTPTCHITYMYTSVYRWYIDLFFDFWKLENF